MSDYDYTAIDAAITLHGAAAVHDATLQETAADLHALGLFPRTLRDVWLIQGRSIERLTPEQKAAADRNNRRALDIIGSASKAGRAPGLTKEILGRTPPA